MTLALAGALLCSALFTGVASATDYTVSVTTDDITPNGNCTLREAVQASNLSNTFVDACPPSVGPDKITLTSPGAYVLDIGPDGTPNDNQDGDLDISGILEITAPVGTQASIFQNDADRILHPQSGILALNGLHLLGGDTGFADGGAVLASGVTDLIVNNSVFEDNRAFGGGAISSSQSVHIEDSHFIFNEAVLNYGGALKVDSGSAAVIGSSFESNSAQDEGGALWFDNATAFEISASSFLDNDANFGGAIYSSGNPALTSPIEDVTIAGNHAVVGGGGLTVETVGDVPVARSILAYNTGGGGASACGSAIAGNAANSHNLVDVNDCGLVAGASDNLLGVDPQLAPAGLYFGGSTVSRAPFIGSPAVDAIPLAECGGSPTDQNGTSRPQPAGGSCDIGAVEGSVPRPVVTPPAVLTPPVAGPTGERAAALKKCKKKKTKKAKKKCRKKAKRLPV